jgi:hypothetical protein
MSGSAQRSICPPSIVGEPRVVYLGGLSPIGITDESEPSNAARFVDVADATLYFAGLVPRFVRWDGAQPDRAAVRCELHRLCWHVHALRCAVLCQLPYRSSNQLLIVGPRR